VLPQDYRSVRLFLAEQSEQHVFRANVSVTQSVGLVGRVIQHALALGGQRYLDRSRKALTALDVLLNFFPDSID